MKTIGVVGSRRRDRPSDFNAVKAAIFAIYEPGDRFVSGGCPRGADRFVELIARELGATITIHHADWHRHGKAAGFRRNGLIANDADELVACVAADRTGGTEDTVRRFRTIHHREPILV